MKNYTDLELLRFSKMRRRGHKMGLFFASIPGKIKKFFVKI